MCYIVYVMLNVDTLSQCQINVVAGVAFAYCASPFGLQRRAFYVISVQVHIIVHVSADKSWGLSAGYQPRPQVVDRGTTARYGGQLRYI